MDFLEFVLLCLGIALVAVAILVIVSINPSLNAILHSSVNLEGIQIFRAIFGF